MKRRILLVVSTLAALAAAFGVYWLVAGFEGLSGPEVARGPRSRPALPVTTQRAPYIQDGYDVLVYNRDRHDRLRGVYRARKWVRQEDGSHLLTEPKVELRHPGGQRTLLRADRAIVYGEELARSVNIRRARFSGNVTVVFDRATAPDRPPIEQRLDELVRIHVDHVELDREQLNIQTDSRVTVFSPEADIYGRGLLVSWNETPRELRTLRIEHGQYMAVYNVPEELEMISLPGGQQAEAAPAPTTAPAGKGAPAGREPAPPATQPLPAPGAKDAGSVRVRVQGAPPASRPAATQTAPASKPVPPQPRNVYVAEFHDGVRVIQRSRKLYGAQTLSLRFEWDPNWARGPEGYPGRRRPTTAPEKAAPASAPPTRGAASAPTSRAAPTTRPAGTEPMEIFWTGPLVIRPVGREPRPSRERYEIAAAGEQVVLTDPRATAVCKEFFFRRPQQSGHLRGAPGSPARLLLAEGADVVCRTIRFDPARGQATLDGAGHLARRFPQGLAQQKAIELIETEPADQPPGGERITWQDHVVVDFEQERVKRPDGSVQTRQFLREADFHGKVELRDSDDPNGDFVKCDRLKAYMKRGKRVAAYPERAVATGKVRARQEGSDVSARKVTVHFRERPEAGGKGKTELQRRGVEPARVIAEGGVRLVDRRDPNSEPLEASADHVDSDVIRRTAVLRGKPARVAQGPNEMTGQVIRLDEKGEAASVDGQGVLRFLTRRGLNNERFKVPRPVEVRWGRQMEFHGARNTAAFRGDVTLRLSRADGHDFMSCQEMQLLFEKPPKAPPAGARKAPPAAGKKAPPAATKPGAAGKEGAPPAASKPALAAGKKAPPKRKRIRSLSVGVERYSQRNIAMILADKEVVLRSRRENDLRQLVRRIQLAGNKLIYDAQAKRMTMLGYGTFMAEDYRKPVPRRPVGPEGMVAAIGRPSRTAFEWHRSMQFSQDDRLVLLDGEVNMVHLSGSQVVAGKGLNVPEWGKIDEGRKTLMTCDNMMAKFGAPDPAAQTKPASDPVSGGPDIGPLELFNATKNVVLVDGPRKVYAQRLIYNRRRDLVVIWGFTEGSPVADARVVYEDPATGRFQNWASPKIIWYRKNNKIITERVTGTGAR